MSSDTSGKKYPNTKQHQIFPTKKPSTFPVEDLPLPSSNNGSIIFPTPPTAPTTRTNQPTTLSSNSTASKPLRPQTHLGGFAKLKKSSQSEGVKFGSPKLGGICWGELSLGGFVWFWGDFFEDLLGEDSPQFEDRIWQWISSSSSPNLGKFTLKFT